MKLQTKIIIAFTTIVVLMGVFQYLYFEQRMKVEFEQYLTNQNEVLVNKLATVFESYYESYGSFESIDQNLQLNPMGLGMGQGRRYGPMQGHMAGTMMTSTIHWLIADLDGRVIADSQSKYYGESSKNIQGTHQVLSLDGTMIGELIILREEDKVFQALEEQYIRSTNLTIIIGTIIGTIIAVIVAFFITREMTQPLKKLLRGIEHVTSGNTDFRVKLHTKDEFYQLSEAFNAMLEQLAQNSKLRDQLMADVAHELRTPLSIIRGKLESFQEGIIEPNQREIMLLVDEVYRLTRLVTDLQQLSLAEAGKLPLNKQPIDIYEFLNKIVTTFTDWSEEKGITITLSGTTTPTILSFDEDRMTQVIVNFLDNALRHTPVNGTIRIHLEEDIIKKEIVVSITDNGPGIEPSLLPYIFERFSRTDHSRSRTLGGTGLGLSIAKGFIEAHNGSVSVHSDIGKGTTFTFRLPMD